MSKSAEPVKVRALELVRTMSERDALMQLAAEGWLIDATTIRKWRLDAGIPAHQRVPVGETPEELRRCVAAWREAGEIRTAAQRLGLSVKTLVRRLERAGEPVGANRPKRGEQRE